MGGVCVGLAVNVTRSPVSNKNSLTSCVCVCVGTNSFMLPKYKYSNTGLMMMKGSRSSQPPAERLCAIKKKKTCTFTASIRKMTSPTSINVGILT